MSGEYSAREFDEYKRRIDERFERLTNELTLQASKRKDNRSLWISVASLAVAVLTLIAVIPKGVLL